MAEKGGRFNLKNPAVKRIMQEMKEMQEHHSADFIAEALENDIFEWHFVIRGPQETEFEGGIYHGRILLPAEYPFKPPAFMMLTPSGRFETGMKICLSISAHHPEHWQPSWSVRTALTALIAFMPSPAAGALGSLDFPKDERKKLAAKSRVETPKFGSADRQKIIDDMHQRMLELEKAVPSSSKSATSSALQSAISEIDPTLPATASNTASTQASDPQAEAQTSASASSSNIATQSASTSSTAPAAPSSSSAVAVASTSQPVAEPAFPCIAPDHPPTQSASPAKVHASSASASTRQGPGMPLVVAQAGRAGVGPVQGQSAGDHGLNLLIFALVVGILAILCRKVLVATGHPLPAVLQWQWLD